MLAEHRQIIVEVQDPVPELPIPDRMIVLSFGDRAAMEALYTFADWTDDDDLSVDIAAARCDC